MEPAAGRPDDRFTQKNKIGNVTPQWSRPMNGRNAFRTVIREYRAWPPQWSRPKEGRMICPDNSRA